MGERRKMMNKNSVVKVKLDEGAIMPTRAHSTDAGMDLYAKNDFIVSGKGSATIDTGVHVEIPSGFVGFLKSKSGLNVNHGLLSEGVIDAGYTGSIVVKIYNQSHKDYKINAGDKISQLVILPCLLPTLELVDSVEEFCKIDSDRGDGGFGSTGK